jgi:predicted tellurium resistance membrane protein TerC
MGLILSLIPRILMLLGIGWVISLDKTPLIKHVPFLEHPITGKDLVLLVGGLFLLYKATKEIHHKLEGADEHVGGAKGGNAFNAVMGQMLIINVVFSIDSVITAIGMVKQVPVMIAAVILSVGCMMLFADTIGKFVQSHPTVNMLALSFLILIGFSLVADGLQQHISKGYVYFAMAFSTIVELLNLRVRGKREPVQLHGPVP